MNRRRLLRMVTTPRGVDAKDREGGWDGEDGAFDDGLSYVYPNMLKEDSPEAADEANDGIELLRRSSYTHKFPISSSVNSIDKYSHLKTNPENGRESMSLSSLQGKQTTFALSVCVLTFFLMGVMGLIYFARRSLSKRRKSYDDIPDENKLAAIFDEPRRKSSVMSASIADLDLAMYNSCVPQKQTIDFVVPGFPTTIQCLNSPANGPSDGTSISSLELDGHLARMAMESSMFVPPGFSVLGGLNPELYRVGDVIEEDDFPAGHRGRIWFELKYNASNEQLCVRLIKAKNLPSRVRGTVNTCDPFVRIYLLPEERRYVQSKVKKKTCNPKFDENFVFQIPVKVIQERMLRLTVFDSDRGKRYNAIGHVNLHLKELDVTSDAIIELRRDLEKDYDEAPSDLGEVYVSLCYNPLIERLTVTVCEGKDYNWPDGPVNVAETVVKLMLMNGNKLVKSKKTGISKKSLTPNYNESFHFKLQPNGLDMANVVLQVTIAQGPNKDKCLGRIVLGSFMFARGKALEHWDAATVASPQKQLRQWHKLT